MAGNIKCPGNVITKPRANASSGWRCNGYNNPITKNMQVKRTEITCHSMVPSITEEEYVGVSEPGRYPFASEQTLQRCMVTTYPVSTSRGAKVLQSVSTATFRVVEHHGSPVGIAENPFSISFHTFPEAFRTPRVKSGSPANRKNPARVTTR